MNNNSLLNYLIGFDPFLTSAAQIAQRTYPPYDVEKYDENTYRVVVAVAGFTEDDLDVTIKESTLVVETKSKPTDETRDDVGPTFLHRGIAKRPFRLPFSLTSDMVVDSVELTGGLLSINMHREIPEYKQPRKIPILTN